MQNTKTAPHTSPEVTFTREALAKLLADTVAQALAERGKTEWANSLATFCAVAQLLRKLDLRGTELPPLRDRHMSDSRTRGFSHEEVFSWASIEPLAASPLYLAAQSPLLCLRSRTYIVTGYRDVHNAASIHLFGGVGNDGRYEL